MRRLVSICAAIAALSNGVEAGALYVAPTPTTQSVIQSDAPAMARWRAAYGKLQSGVTTSAKILVLDDSNGAGVGSAGAVGTANKTLAWPSQLATILTARGMPARESSFIGTNVDINAATNVAGYDPRLTFGAGWSPQSATLGGYFFANFTNTNLLSFAPTQTFDTIDVYFSSLPSGLGSFTINIDGGASLGTVNCNTGITGIAKQTFTVTLGAHTVNIARASGNIFILGVDTRNSAGKEVSILNGAVGAGRTADFAVAGNFAPMIALAAIAPDLTILCLVLNDSNNLLSQANYRTNLQTIITAVKATGSSLLMRTAIPGGTTNTLSSQESYTAIFRDLAASNNVPLIDVTARWGTYSASNALGLNYDTLHPSKSGYHDIARALAAPILSY